MLFTVGLIDTSVRATQSLIPGLEEKKTPQISGNGPKPLLLFCLTTLVQNTNGE